MARPSGGCTTSSGSPTRWSVLPSHRSGSPRRPRRGAAPDALSPGRRFATADPLEGAGRADAAAEGDLARGDQGEAVGAVRLAAGLAGFGLGHRAVRLGRA